MNLSDAKGLFLSLTILVTSLTLLAYTKTKKKMLKKTNTNPNGSKWILMKSPLMVCVKVTKLITADAALTAVTMRILIFYIL